MRKPIKKQFVSVILIAVFLGIINPFFVEAKEFTADAAKLYSEAVQAYRTRHFTLAKKAFYELIEKYPDDGYTDIGRSNLASMLKDLKEYDKAAEILKEIIKTSSNFGDIEKAKIELVDILRSRHRYREGVELLETWIRSEPNNIVYARKLAAFYLQSGGKDEAWLLLERFTELGHTEAFKDLLELATRTGEIDKLISNLESRRNRYKSSVYATLIADCYLALGLKDKAIEALKENENHTKDIAVLRKLADIELASDSIDEAIVTLERLTSYLPADWQSARKLGHCYFLKEKKDKAIKIWRKVLMNNYDKQQAYIEYTAVLIEHRLLVEALEAFDEARMVLGQDVVFAEEKAAVLETLGRKAEAMEEYIKVLQQGIYKEEVFNKLYKAENQDFSLEKRLMDLNNGDFNQGITRSLIEYYFRKAKISDIDKMAALVDEQFAIFFDDLFFNRLKQEALLVPEQFHFNLIKRVLEMRVGSVLELKLAALMLRMPNYNEKWLSEAYEIAKKVADSQTVADPNLKYELYLNLAEFAIETMASPKEADNYLSKLLKRNLIRASKKQIVEAKLMRAKIKTYESEFSSAEEILNDLEKNFKTYDFFSGGLSRIEHDEYTIKTKLELGKFMAHKGDYQKALDYLKDIVENHKEGDEVNDALELALKITRYSIGDFTVISHKLASERLAAIGKISESIKELEAAIKATPVSLTLLIKEMEADNLLLSSKVIHNEALIKKIELFLATNPNCYKNPDLYEFKIKLMQRGNHSADKIDEEMKSFMDKFPNDLRCGKYRQIFENGGN